MGVQTNRSENRLATFRRELLWLPLLVFAISLGHYLTPLELSGFHDVLRRFYYIPIFFGALHGGTRGGLMVAVLSGLFYAPHIIFQWESHSLDHIGHEGHFNKYIEISIFLLFGALFGRVFDRLRKATEDLKLSYEAGRTSSRLVALGRLSAGLAHEIRTPLAGIRSSLDVIESECDESSGEVIQEFLGLARQEIDRADRLIRELLDFAKPREPQLGPVSVAKLLESIRPLILTQAQVAGVNVESRCDQGISEFVIDVDQIKQVVLNLILNAVQNASDSILIEAYEDKQVVIIEVSDNGSGVAEELSDRIFDPFFTTRDDGVGLGLSISHQIVTQHKGSLTLSSPGKLGGATFKLCLPIVTSTPCP